MTNIDGDYTTLDYVRYWAVGQGNYAYPTRMLMTRWPGPCGTIPDGIITPHSWPAHPGESVRGNLCFVVPEEELESEIILFVTPYPPSDREYAFVGPDDFVWFATS